MITMLRMMLIALLFTTSAWAQTTYTFQTINVDFPAFHEDLFGCAATGLNDIGAIVGACNDQATNNGETRGFLYDGRRFSEIDFNRAKVKGESILDAVQSVYQNRNSTKQIVRGTTPLGINNQGAMTGLFGSFQQSRTRVRLPLSPSLSRDAGRSGQNRCPTIFLMLSMVAWHLRRSAGTARAYVSHPRRLRVAPILWIIGAAMARPSNVLIDILIFVIVISIALATVWLIKPQILSMGCSVLSNNLQRALGCL